MWSELSRGKDFGRHLSAYGLGRKGFPEAVYDRFRSRLRPGALVLDIGCGTGIATRGMSKTDIFCVGCDIDPRMITEALYTQSENVSYVLAPAENLPFSEGTFDGATVFSALHWFCNAAALSEIHRVVKKTGIVAVVNKFDEGDAKEQFRALVQQITGHAIPNPKTTYAPFELIEGAGFRIATALSVPYEEVFDAGATRQYFMSTSISHALDDLTDRTRIEPLLENFFSSLMDDEGRYIRALRATLILALNYQ